MIHVGDGTWNLRILITDLQCEKTLRVKGDLHIGGVMLKLVDPGWCSFFIFFKENKLILIIICKPHKKPLECIEMSLCLVFLYTIFFLV